MFYNAPAQFKKSDKSPTVQFLQKRGYKFQDTTDKEESARMMRRWPDTLYYNTTYVARLLGSPTIPISFSRIEYVDGKYQVSPTISLGLGYTWFTGNFIFNENDKISIDPKLFFGLVADVGLQNDFSFKELTGIFAGGFVGFGNFSLFSGYDFMTRSPSIGLGGRIDLYTVSQNFMRPIGKVKELRKHKKRAVPIEDE
ncbi:MAG: hypothetical protein K0S53_1889 [Bacteroidetes bacterium]|jgi:hypothetical protein|nr:hypothetical protein [Bacteroidota bacterium]MDF2450929.1 hypothetical protein [Bacteroidota bacterium]